MDVTVLGAGAWGTALAVQAAARNSVLLWGRDAAQVERLRTERCNERYLAGVTLPPSLELSDDLHDALKRNRRSLLVIATPMAGLREMLKAVPDDSDVLWLCKGFEAGTGLLGHEIARTVRPRAHCGVLSGPSFALEVALGRRTALVAASEDDTLSQRAVAAFHGDRLRVYRSTDVVGVEVGGAVKNVLAIATGIADGLELGLNARAALITRGLAEMARLGAALGGRSETFMGLSGLGDLVLTSTGELSRNRRVGMMLAAGRSLPEILHELGHVAEGVHTAAVVLKRAKELDVEMPITEVVVGVLEGRMSAADAVDVLMRREAKSEH
ncbi:MAG TPA: NAD(P)H-dependent glycerol-3-phosphate dehydrogenase [Burkholderiaceae bacterium]|nr:NAD(P)H-dependent glycerol-3-phosphate dehydrogenase [Burkholderiaceae bacterium]